MLVGQQLGPFLIEKELGAGAMGAVYRGKYVKTGQIVAIKVMAPGLGTSSASAAARFEREAKILKQLNHPNIVRLFGIGKYHGTPYYAMEYIQGESLDRVMARRDRMSWEEVVDLGLQLCSALQHAHDAGIIHRDLKPSNLMILSDGTVKLTDFGIAKDVDVTQLTGANCAIGTAAYMSPEQCKGDPNITFKSDLYSMGILFYELITGRKPFNAENAMDMFMLHVNGKFERPSRIVLDLPMWMDTLICHLMEKKPDQRPRDAAMVASILGSIQEKVEAQHSAGVDIARARAGERPDGMRGKLSEEDAIATRSLLGKKTRKKKQKPGDKLIWLKAVGLLFVLALVIAGIWYGVQPPSAEQLYRQAERLMTSKNDDKIDQAREKPIAEYLRRYGSQENDQAKQVRQWADDYDAARYEKLFDRHINHVEFKKGFAVEAQNPSEELAFKAALQEYKGERAEAVRMWQKVAEGESATTLGMVAQRHLSSLARIDEVERTMQDIHTKIRDFRNEETLPDELAQQAFLGWRQQKIGDQTGAHRRYHRLRDDARKRQDQLQEPGTRDVASAEWQRRLADARFWLMFAACKSKQIDEDLGGKEQSDEVRTKLVTQRLSFIRSNLTNPQVKVLDLRLLAHDISIIYGSDPGFAPEVKEARTLRDSLDGKLGKR